MDKKTVRQLHDGILCSSEKGPLIICYGMDGPEVYYAKSHKPVSERQIPCDLTCVWNLMNRIN